MCSECRSFSEEHKEELNHALALLNIALADYDARHAQVRQITDEMGARMGQTIQTQGCPKCQGTMYKTVETDENGVPTGETQWVCSSCGNVS